MPIKINLFNATVSEKVGTCSFDTRNWLVEGTSMIFAKCSVATDLSLQSLIVVICQWNDSRQLSPWPPIHLLAEALESAQLRRNMSDMAETYSYVAIEVGVVLDFSGEAMNG